MKNTSKGSNGKFSKKTLWVLGAFIVAALGYILYRFSLIREGQDGDEDYKRLNHLDMPTDMPSKAVNLNNRPIPY
jgi:hypothetical protein